MNSIADKIQAAMEESWMEKECAVAEQDYHKAAAIRDWGEKLKKLIAEARQIDQTTYPTTTVHVSPFDKLDFEEVWTRR